MATKTTKKKTATAKPRGGGDNSGKGASKGKPRGGGDNSGKGALQRKK